MIERSGATNIGSQTAIPTCNRFSRTRSSGPTPPTLAADPEFRTYQTHVMMISDATNVGGRSIQHPKSAYHAMLDLKEEASRAPGRPERRGAPHESPQAGPTHLPFLFSLCKIDQRDIWWSTPRRSPDSGSLFLVIRDFCRLRA